MADVKIRVLGGLEIAGAGDAPLTRKAKAVAAYRAEHRDDAVLLATGITHGAMGEPITRQMLARIVSDIPFIVGCFDHPTLWANTKALEMDLQRALGRPFPLDEVAGLTVAKLRELK